MSRTNLGGITENDIELPSGLSWDINISSLNLSRATRRLYFSDSISQSGEFEIETVFTPKNIQGGDKLKISKEGQDAFYGIVYRPGKSSQGESTISGGGAAEALRDIPINSEFLGYNSVDVVTEVFGSLDAPGIRVGVNEELTSSSGAVDARADDEGALNFLNRVIQSHDGEWYTSYDAQDDVFEFNVVNKLESSNTVKTFSQNNTKKIEDQPVVDEQYDGVVVKGYGDGDDQISGEYPARSSWPNDPKILKFTDKTILSKGEADNVAESVYNTHDEWRSIYVYPSSHEELLNLGDKTDISEPRTGVSGTYRVVARTLNLDFKGQKQVEYVLSDKPLGIIDEAEDVEQQTKSQTDYGQGNRNTINENNSGIADSTQGTTIELNVPEDLVKDETGKNRTAKVLLDYKVKDYNRLIPYGESNVVNSDTPTNPVLTSVDNFGVLEKTKTNSKSLGGTESTSARFLGEDTDSENTGEGVSNESLVVKPYREDSGTESIVDTTGNGFANKEIDFDTNFNNTPVINISMADPTSEPGANELFRQWIDQANSNDFNVDSQIPIDQGYVCHWSAKERVSLNSVTIDGEVPSAPSASGDSGRKSVVGVSYTAYIVNFSDNGTGLDFDIDIGPYSDFESVFASSGSAVSYQNTILDSSIDEGDNLTVQFDADAGDSIETAPGSEQNTLLGFIIETITDQNHKVEEASDASDRVVAFTEKSDGANIDAGVDGSTSDFNSKNESVPSTTTDKIGELTETELIVETVSTSATSADIYVNGDLFDSRSLDESDVDITSEISPGKNTVEIRPDAKSEVQGNIIVDHKISGERK